MKFRTRFNVDEFPRDGLVCDTPSMTQQHFKDECDINTIVNRYKVTGILGDPTDQRQPIYADVSDLPDLMTAQNMVIDAQEKFASLPSNIRKRFDNSPIAMLEFLQDSNNREEAEKLGLINASITNQPDIGGNSNFIADSVPMDNVRPVEKTVNNVEK